jgi:hypothetical protein
MVGKCGKTLLVIKSSFAYGLIRIAVVACAANYLQKQQGGTSITLSDVSMEGTTPQGTL